MRRRVWNYRYVVHTGKAVLRRKLLIPITSMIVVSLLLPLVVNLIARFLR